MRARKIKPGYAEGPLVKVIGASHQAEADFIQGLLLEEGIPSLQRRAAGSDVPDFLAAGRRDVLVAQSAAQAAREVLLQSELVQADGELPKMVVNPLLLVAVLLIALAAFAAIIALARL